LYHCPIVASVTLSPKVGTRISIAIFCVLLCRNVMAGPAPVCSRLIV
jgi:hypothetical protein